MPLLRWSLESISYYAGAFSVRRRRVCESCKSTLYTLEQLEKSLIEEGLLDGCEEKETVEQDGKEEKRSLTKENA